MPRMRHPRVDDAIEAPDSAVTAYRMSGWVTEEEDPDLFVSDHEPEPEGDEGDGDETPQSKPEPNGEDKTPAPRRTRASSKESE